MGMLTKEDLQQIGGLLVENNKVLKTELKAELKTEIVSDVLEGVGEMIEQNLFPKFDAMDARLLTIENTVATLPTKDFVTEKIGELRGEMVTGFKKIDSRFDEMTFVLKDKRIISQDDVTRIDAKRLYPRPTV